MQSLRLLLKTVWIKPALVREFLVLCFKKAADDTRQSLDVPQPDA
jgi:hypothetical protein